MQRLGIEFVCIQWVFNCLVEHCYKGWLGCSGIEVGVRVWMGCMYNRLPANLAPVAYQKRLFWSQKLRVCM